MNAEISRRILNEMNNGKTIQEAFDAVLGEGSYARLAGDVYDALRK